MCCLFAVVSLCDLVSNAADGIPGTFYCTFCTKYFNSQEALSDHCLSSEHKFNVSSDKEHQWNYRAPPWTVSRGNFKLCEKWVLKIMTLHYQPKTVFKYIVKYSISTKLDDSEKMAPHILYTICTLWNSKSCSVKISKLENHKVNNSYFLAISKKCSRDAHFTAAATGGKFCKHYFRQLKLKQGVVDKAMDQRKKACFAPRDSILNTRGVQKVRRPTQLSTRYAYRILSLFNMITCNWNALGSAFLQRSDTVVEELLFLVFQAAICRAIRTRMANTVGDGVVRSRHFGWQPVLELICDQMRCPGSK